MREVYEYIRDQIAEIIGVTPFNGPMPPTAGYALFIDDGTVDTTFLSTGIVYDMGLLFNAKGPNQVELYNNLTEVHKALTQRKEWAQGENWQITNVRTDSMPRFMGREDNVNFEYGSGFNVRFLLFKGENE